MSVVGSIISKAPVVSLSKELSPHWLVLIGSSVILQANYNKLRALQKIALNTKIRTLVKYRQNVLPWRRRTLIIKCKLKLVVLRSKQLFKKPVQTNLDSVYDVQTHIIHLYVHKNNISKWWHCKRKNDNIKIKRYFFCILTFALRFNRYFK